MPHQLKSTQRGALGNAMSAGHSTAAAQGRAAGRAALCSGTHSKCSPVPAALAPLLRDLGKMEEAAASLLLISKTSGVGCL